MLETRRKMIKAVSFFFCSSELDVKHFERKRKKKRENSSQLPNPASGAMVR
jgi:hypothetical protein